MAALWVGALGERWHCEVFEDGCSAQVCRRQREEWSLVVRCVHHPASCVCGIGVAGLKGVWRELGLVEGLVLGMGAVGILPKGIVKL